mmetsp:Transcript_15202/g.54736  ORF Transcript_15202/g.54736 Transcript_15202/m.54736 type:complete len:599 (-) Transcript_15202:685-2481(-)
MVKKMIETHELSWLPHKLPSGVACVISTLGREPGIYETGRCLEVLKDRGCDVIAVPPLGLSQRRELFERTLATRGKGYAENQMFPCWTADASRNAMYMTLLLAEMLSSGKWATLNALVERLLGFVRACKEVLQAEKPEGWEEADSVETFVEETLAGGRARLLPPLIDGCERTIAVWGVKRLERAPYEGGPSEGWTYPADIPALQNFYQEHQALVHAKMGTSVPELVGLIFDRLEGGWPDELVREVLLCLLVSREGLYEYELIQLVNSDRDTIAQLIGAVRHLLNERSGMLIFSHDFVRRAVQMRLVQDDMDIAATTHAKMARYFYSRGGGIEAKEDAKLSRPSEMFSHHAARSGLSPSDFISQDIAGMTNRLNFSDPETSASAPVSVILKSGAAWKRVKQASVGGSRHFTGLTWANGVLACATTERCYCMSVDTSDGIDIATRIVASSGTACLSPNGKYVVAMQDDGRTFGLFETESSALVGNIEVGEVMLVTFSPDGNRIAVFGAGSSDKSPGARIFDPHTGFEVCCLWTNVEVGHEGFCQNLGGVAFSPDSRYVVAGCSAQGVAIFDASTGLEACRVCDPVEGKPGVVGCVAWAPS